MLVAIAVTKTGPACADPESLGDGVLVLALSDQLVTAALQPRGVGGRDHPEHLIVTEDDAHGAEAALPERKRQSEFPKSVNLVLHRILLRTTTTHSDRERSQRVTAPSSGLSALSDPRADANRRGNYPFTGEV